MDGMPAPFTIAFIPGVTLTRWTTAWQSRQRAIPLAFVSTDVDDQVSVLTDGTADVSFVRLPIDRTGLSVIPLYEETPVAVLSHDDPLSERSELTLADLLSSDRVPESLTPEDAVELVAAGGGIVIMPQSVARMHARKDVVARPVTDAEPTQISLAWLEQNTTPEIEEFVGIVRGRTATSSRAVPTPKTEKPRKEPMSKPKPRTAIQRQRPRKPRGR